MVFTVHWISLQPWNELIEIHRGFGIDLIMWICVPNNTQSSPRDAERKPKHLSTDTIYFSGNNDIHHKYWVVIIIFREINKLVINFSAMWDCVTPNKLLQSKLNLSLHPNYKQIWWGDWGILQQNLQGLEIP